MFGVPHCHYPPMCFDWTVPVYSSQKIHPGVPLRGYFAVDVLAEKGKDLPPGKYAAYVVMNGAIYGPAKFEWAAPDVSPWA